ncbi:MAG: hypothetical protein HZB85_05665 [Deltaproteobacteria bacterium]|nr:hypothetical protein [Deltaproteobacteria bacterium]
MRVENFINFFLAFGLFYYSIIFLKDYYRERYQSNRIIKSILLIDYDKFLRIFIRNLRWDIIKASNRLAFWICIIAGVLTAMNGLFAFLFEAVPNVAMIFIVIGFLGSWVGKYIFLYLYKDRPIEDIPRFLQ